MSNSSLSLKNIIRTYALAFDYFITMELSGEWELGNTNGISMTNITFVVAFSRPTEIFKRTFHATFRQLHPVSLERSRDGLMLKLAHAPGL